MRRLLYLVPVLLVLAMVSCSSKLTSTGDTLDDIEKAGKAAEGKEYSLTLSQINVERSADTVYLRLFDKSYKTIFVYMKKEMKNKVLNLDRNAKYIYKFKLTKNDKTTTMSGDLIDVAGLDGVPVSKTLKSKDPNSVSIVIDGPEAIGKEFTLEVKFYKLDETDGKKVARFNSTDPYEKEVTLTYADALKAKLDGLKAGDTCKAKFKLESVDWRLFGSAVSIE